MSTHGDYLAPPPRKWVDHKAEVPLSPVRPPFEHYHSSSSLPMTPRTPFPGAAPSGRGSLRTDAIPSTRLQPYLTLPPRIFLVFLTPAILPLILTITHLFLNRSSTASLADSLRSSLLSACDGLAHGAASLQSMPRYLAIQTNQEVIRATQASILAIGVLLMDSVTIIETVVTFIVDTYRSMLLCTIELAVRGSLELLIGAVKTISDGVTSSLNSIRTNIQNDISSANSVIQSAVDRINSVTTRVNIEINVPQFSIPSLDAMQNVEIPTTFEDSLIKLNSTLPTLTELKQKLDDIISVPFELLKKEINETRIEMAASFNDSALPVPSLQQLSADGSNSLRQELCGDLDTSLIDDTEKALHKLSTVAIGLMFLLLILIWATLCFYEWRKWRALKNTIETVEEEWKRDDTRDVWRVVAIVEHPILERYGRRVFDRLKTTKTTEVNIRWYLAYLAHPTCLALLLISLFGFLSIQFQLIALDAIKDHARENANSTVQASTQSLASKLNAYALESSQEYANNFNTAILAHQNRINNELFGSWLNTTAVTLNNTLVEFYDDVENILQEAFGGTIIYGPINTFLYCILGSKITNLEKGLSWVSEHAYITLPTLPPNVLMLSNDLMTEIAEPIAAAAVGSGGDGDEGIVGSLIEHFEKALTFERNFYAILLGLWLAFALIGLVVVLWNSGGRDRYYAIRGVSRNDKPRVNGRATPGLKWLPWNKEHPIFDEHAEKPHNVPRIVEPGQNQTSFFDYVNAAPRAHSTPRPSAARKGTFGSGISSLAAPGQAFLRSTSWKPTDDVHLPEKTNLVHGSSEKYTANRQLDEKRQEEEESLPDAPVMWVNKWYRATERAKSFFPSRGQRHGEAVALAGGRDELKRNKDSDPSFGASQAGRTEDAGPSWRMADSPTIGRALDGVDDGGRYPLIHSTSLTNTSGGQDQNPFDRAEHVPPVPRLVSDNVRDAYPRRMSRAPTVSDGADLDPFNPFGNYPPVSNKKHDSVDYLEDVDDEPEDDRRQSYLPYTSQYSPDSPAGYDHSCYANQGPYEDHARGEEVLSPASSSISYLHNEAHVKSVSKVQTGTAALASLFDSMRENKAQGAGRENPFSTPFDDNARGGRI